VIRSAKAIAAVMAVSFTGLVLVLLAGCVPAPAPPPTMAGS
jgi:hypothetical protein